MPKRTAEDGPAIALELSRLEVSGMDAPAVESAVAKLGKLRGWVDATEASLAARAEQLAKQGSGGGARETLALKGGRSGREAQKAADRAGTLAANPELGDALANGGVSSDHVDALTRAAAPLPDDTKHDLLNDPELNDAARRMRPEPFAKLCNRKARKLAEDEGEDKLQKQKNATKLKTWWRKDGMLAVNGELDPEHGNRFLASLDAEVDTMAQRDRAPKTDRTRALALVALAERGLGAGPNTTPSEVVVIDAATLDDGLHEHSVCETTSGVDLPPETVRRIMCDAVVFPTVIRASDGQVLFAGRQIRTANRAQRRALRAMYATCAFDSCSVSFDHCQVHHIVPWHRGGPTDLPNLIPLCNRHHHLVHEGRWHIRLLADRSLVITQPDGRHHKTVPLPSADLGQAVAAHGPASEGNQTDTGPPDACAPPRPTRNRAA